METDNGISGSGLISQHQLNSAQHEPVEEDEEECIEGDFLTNEKRRIISLTFAFR